jgi:hypothetical protein
MSAIRNDAVSLSDGGPQVATATVGELIVFRTVFQGRWKAES